ncbi:MAG TPA: hypothetical protein VMC43_02930, partial [Candidatus Paceibacterota bacterium]|nr:hypothetical protein [Candidatus Paceibacterota bacterium]
GTNQHYKTMVLSDILAIPPAILFAYVPDEISDDDEEEEENKDAGKHVKEDDESLEEAAEKEQHLEEDDEYSQEE